jgi:hypothetical protein
MVTVQTGTTRGGGRIPRLRDFFYSWDFFKGLRSVGLRPSPRGLPPEFHEQIEKSNISCHHQFTMESFDLRYFKTINTIIEQDSKDTTYKYALLRGAVEISQEYQHLKRENGNRIEFPLGLLIEKWLLYYYPFIEHEIPQKHREGEKAAKQISFRRTFRKITDFYEDHGKFSAFYRDYTKGSIPDAIIPAFRSLVRELRKTITQYPMKHLGHSAANQYYSVFDFDCTFPIPSGKFPVDRDYLIRNMGTYLISREYDTIFEILGSFIAGEDAVLFQWAEFTRSASKGNVSLAKSLEQLRTFPVTERDIGTVRSFYEKLQREQKVLPCVWSGDPIRSGESLDVDHLIPFSVLRNNDLWNLLPALKKINKDKLAKIPSPAFIEERKSAIKYYWTMLRAEYPQQFDREMAISLTGTIDTGPDWQEIAIQKLIEKCRYFIDVRGFDSWRR